MISIPFQSFRRNSIYLSLLLTPMGLLAQTLGPDERSFAMSNLYISRMKFLDAIDGLSPVQLAFKPSPERWSIAECAEHITLSEDMLFKMAERALAAPAVKRDLGVYLKVDQQIMKSVVDRSKKVQAPEALQPSHKWKTMDAMLTEFKQKRMKTIEWVELTNADVRGHVLPHPEFKELDAFQWVLLLSAHTERHTLQILEVKANPKFPEK